MPSWKKVITSGSDAALNSLNVTSNFTASGLNYPDIDGTVGQVIITDGAGNLSFAPVENTAIVIKNVSGITIAKGTPCYITGSGTSGNLAGVWPADAADPTRMPAGVIAGETLIAGAEGVGLINGYIGNVNTSAFAAGNSIYVAVGGGYTNVRPTGSGVLIQKLGNVEKSHASNGSGVINGPAYYNEVPNIQQGFTWVGNSNGVAIPIATSSIQNVISSSFASTAANIAPAIANDVDTRVITANGNGTLNGEGNLTFNGQTLSVLYGVGDEGGEILLGKAATNTTLTGSGVTVDVFQNRLRFFEQGGTARGYYLDITAGGAGASTNLASGGSGTVTSVDTSGSVSGITLTGGPITGAGTIVLGGTITGLTTSNLSATAGILNAQLANSSITIGSTNIDLGDTATSLTGLTSINSTSFTGSLLGTASYATNALSASYAPSTPAFPYNGDAQISGSLGVTGSFTTQTFDGLNYVNAISIGNFSRAIYDVMGTSSFDADGRTLFDDMGIFAVNWSGRTLFDATGTANSIAWGSRLLYDATSVQSIDWANRLAYDTSGTNYSIDWSSGILRDTNAKNSVDWQNRTTLDTNNKKSIDWENRKLLNTAETELLNWQNQITITGSATVSGSLELTGSFKMLGAYNGFTGPFKAIEIDDANFTRQLFDTSAGIVSIDFGNRSLNTSTGGPAISWDGSAGTYNSNLYEAQRIDLATRDNIFSFNALAGQVLDESYFDAAVSNDELVYLNTDGLWYQVDQTTDTSTKMLGIAKNINSQTGSVFIEGDITVTTGTGYPQVAGANYGLPIYIKQGAGTAMDTTIPTSGYVRLLGYCYHNPSGTEWIMKFRPSNEWYVI